MDKKKKLLIMLLVFVLLLGGASVLYKQLGKNADANQLASETEVSTSEEQDDKDEAENEKAMAPDMTVYDRDGKEVHLSDYIGKPIVLNFWASWCGHARWKCRILMRSIRSLEKKYSF